MSSKAVSAAETPTSGIFTVFSIENADRLTLATQKGQLLPIVLGYVTCPKLARRTPSGEVTAEDPCAYEAFEFLRSQIIGKQVKFEEEFRVEALGRSGGRVTLSDGSDCGLELLKAGLAQVPERIPPKMPKDLHTTYLAAQTTAKQSGLGIWNPKSKARVLRPFPCPEGFLDKLQQQTAKEPVKILVEKVISGSLISVLLVSNPTQQISVSLSGIICPSAVQRDPKTGEVSAIGIAAKTHTERFLLHRHVLMRFEGVDPQNGNALGSVISPKGTFQEELLKRGFARTLTATIIQSGSRDALVAAEKEAQQAKLGVWENFEPAAVQAGGETRDQQAAALIVGETHFQGTICQVISGDTLVVRSVDPVKNEVKYNRLTLHGVRAPKTIKRADGSDPSTRGSETRLSYEEYTWEAREFMRTKFIGQGVNVQIESVVPSNEPGREPRRSASIKDLQGNSIGAALVGAGLARVMVTRTEAPPGDMDALVAAEADARAKKLGVHSGNPSAVTHVTEVNRVGDKKGKQYLGFLHRGKQGSRPPVLSGVVDVVLSGSAFRVYIPREHIIITLKLAGVSSPAGPAPGSNGEGDAFHVESKDYAIQQLQQRDVDIMVDTSDRTGSFIGYVIQKPSNKQFAPAIVAAGFAAPLGAERTSIAPELDLAVKKAQADKVGVWSRDGALPARVARRSAAAVSQSTSFTTLEDHPWIPIRVTEVVSNNVVYVFAETEENLQQREALQALLVDVANVKQEERRVATAPKRGDIVACYFKEDKTWNRAKILAVFDKDYEVQYLDFGNKGEPSHRDVRPIPNEQDFDLLRTAPPLAEQVSLAYIRPLRTESEQLTSAIDKIWEFTESCEQHLQGRVEYTVGSDRRYITIAQAKNYLSTLQEELLRQGVSQIESSMLDQGKKSVGSSHTYYFKTLADSQAYALKNHRGMFEYGDALSEDDDDDY